MGETAMPSPINVAKLEELLQGYDKQKSQYLLNGFRNGFSIGSSLTSTSTKAKNHLTVQQFPTITETLIKKELEAKRYAGPFKEVPFQNFHVSPLKLTPKKLPGEYRLIQNLSYPYDEKSVNHAIPTEFSSVEYATIQDAIDIIQYLGPNCFMAKSDIKSAFRLIPVSPNDYHLLGFSFNQHYYFDKCLAQGCSSSCQIFEAFANALEWILCNKFGVRYCLHVLDDFCFVAPTLFECQQYLNAWISLCSVLGVPLAEEKTCNPSQVMIFLGIELSTVKMMAQLPVDKLRRYSDIISDASKSRKVKLCEMQSIIGCLQFATSVIVPGKAFIRRLIDRTLGVSVPFHYVTLNEEAKKDLDMWQKFLRFHNGKTIFISQTLTSGDIQLYTDASKLACSAIFNKQWFVVKFPIQWQSRNIAFLELYPIVLALHIFGIKMCNRHVIFHCDNKAICDIINKQTSKDKEIMVLVRSLVLVCMQYNVRFCSLHLTSKQNFRADKLSRLQVSPELLSSWGMNLQPHRVPTHLLPGNFKDLWQGLWPGPLRIPQCGHTIKYGTI